KSMSVKDIINLVHKPEHIIRHRFPSNTDQEQHCPMVQFTHKVRVSVDNVWFTFLVEAKLQNPCLSICVKDSLLPKMVLVLDESQKEEKIDQLNIGYESNSSYQLLMSRSYVKYMTTPYSDCMDDKG